MVDLGDGYPGEIGESFAFLTREKSGIRLKIDSQISSEVDRELTIHDSSAFTLRVVGGSKPDLQLSILI